MGSVEVSLWKPAQLGVVGAERGADEYFSLRLTGLDNKKENGRKCDKVRERRQTRYGQR